VREDGSSRIYSVGDLHGARRVLFYDGLEESCRWTIARNRFGASVGRSQDLVYYGDWAGKLIGGASVPNGYVSTYCFRDFIGIPKGEVMVRAVLGSNGGGDMSRVAIYVLKVLNGVLRMFGVRIDITNGRPMVLNSLGLWEYCSDNPVYLSGSSWHLFEVVVEWTIGVYRAARINENQFDVSGFSYQKKSVGIEEANQGIRIVQYMSGAGLTLYFDEVAVVVE
jgi:hypothetical protein